MLVLGRDKEVSAWVAARVGIEPVDFGHCVGIGVTDGEEMMAGFVYHDYRINQIEVSAAADTPRWAARSIIRELFRYPFEIAKVGRLQTVQAVGNDRARKLVEGLGFVHEGVARRGHYNGKDANVFSMLSDECHWLKEDHG